MGDVWLDCTPFIYAMPWPGISERILYRIALSLFPSPFLCTPGWHRFSAKKTFSLPQSPGPLKPKLSGKKKALGPFSLFGHLLMEWKNWNKNRIEDEELGDLNMISQVKVSFCSPLSFLTIIIISPINLYLQLSIIPFVWNIRFLLVLIVTRFEGVGKRKYNKGHKVCFPRHHHSPCMVK